MNLIETLLVNVAVGTAVSVFTLDYSAHWQENIRELHRPWKLATLAAGLSWLIYGALSYGFPDWTVGLSLAMGLYAYIVAPWCAEVLFYGRWQLVPVAAIMYWIGVDGLYVLCLPAEASEPMREANFYASSGLFWLCGFLWMLKGERESYHVA